MLKKGLGFGLEVEDKAPIDNIERLNNKELILSKEREIKRYSPPPPPPNTAAYSLVPQKICFLMEELYQGADCFVLIKVKFISIF